MEQNLTWWQILFDSNAFWTIVGSLLGFLMSYLLFKAQAIEGRKTLKILLAERFMNEESRERKKFSSLLYSKVTDAYVAAVSAWWAKDIDKARKDLVTFYKRHYLLFGFEKPDHENMTKFFVNLLKVHDNKDGKEKGLQIDMLSDHRNYQETEENFEKIVDSIFRKNKAEQLAVEGINFVHSITEKVEHADKKKEMIDNG